jgi:hypothetical protein
MDLINIMLMVCALMSVLIGVVNQVIGRYDRATYFVVLATYMAVLVGGVR